MMENVFQIQSAPGGEWLLDAPACVPSLFAKRDFAVLQALCCANEVRPSRVVVRERDGTVSREISFREHRCSARIF
jgi:hypothetical protein